MIFWGRFGRQTLTPEFASDSDAHEPTGTSFAQTLTCDGRGDQAQGVAEPPS